MTGGRLAGKVALVTGAGGSIGRAMAVRFAREGATVGVHYHTNEHGAWATLDEMGHFSAQGATFAADLRSADAARDLVDRAADHFGRLDILVNNSGVTSWGPFLEYKESDFDNVVLTNLKGPYFASQAAARRFIQQQSTGRIVLISSLAGVNAMPMLSAYSMTKAGLCMLARSLSLELGGHGITVNAIGVGPTLNERNLHDDPDYEAHWSGLIPAGRPATVEDTCAAAVYLCSDEASFVNGTTLMVDGGWSAYGPTPRYDAVEVSSRGT